MIADSNNAPMSNHPRFDGLTMNSETTIETRVPECESLFDMATMTRDETVRAPWIERANEYLILAGCPWRRGSLRPRQCRPPRSLRPTVVRPSCIGRERRSPSMGYLKREKPRGSRAGFFYFARLGEMGRPGALTPTSDRQEMESEHAGNARPARKFYVPLHEVSTKAYQVQTPPGSSGHRLLFTIVRIRTVIQLHPLIHADIIFGARSPIRGSVSCPSRTVQFRRPSLPFVRRSARHAARR
jgi:hypothetical protein